MKADEADLPLPELLRRCHRDELLPLARALGVNPDGVGLGQLAAVCAGTLRRQGGHVLGNLLKRKGEGPPYEAVIQRLAAKLVGPGRRGVEEAEAALLMWWAGRAWGQLSGAQRAGLASALGLGDLPEQPPDAATLAVRGRPGELVPWGAGVAKRPGIAALLLLPVLPVAWFILLIWLGRPRDETLLPAVLEVARLRQVVRHRVTVGVVGSPSAGKDAGVKAIFGVDSGNIHPVAGSTREVAITRLEGATGLYVVNTPGMGDVVEAVTEEARQVLDHIDLYLYVVNAQGGVQERELADYQRCVETGRPTLAIVNKIDTLRPADRDRYLADARAKLGAPEADFLAAAFDPLPQLSESPLGITEVRAWIETHLAELGKDPRELPWIEGPGGR